MKGDSRRGLSLLEIVISISILVVVFFTTYQIFMLGFRGYRMSQYSTELMKLAQAHIEEVVQDRRPEGPRAVASWVSFADPAYMYKIDVEFYNTTGASGFDPPSSPHTPYNVDPNYDIYAVTLYAKGPVNPDLSDGSLTKTIILKTIVAPDATFSLKKCACDENRGSGASNLWNNREPDRNE